MTADERHYLDQLLAKLDDLDPIVRRDAAMDLGDFCPKNHPAVNVLIERLRSPQQTLPDRACAALALGRIGAKACEVIPILLTLIEEMKDQADADALRLFAAEAIEKLTGEMDVLLPVACRCLADRFWKCRVSGLSLAERLLKRQPEVSHRLVPLLEPLVNDEVDEIRENAVRLLVEFEE